MTVTVGDENIFADLNRIRDRQPPHFVLHGPHPVLLSPATLHLDDLDDVGETWLHTGEEVEVLGQFEARLDPADSYFIEEFTRELQISLFILW